MILISLILFLLLCFFSYDPHLIDSLPSPVLASSSFSRASSPMVLIILILFLLLCSIFCASSAVFLILLILFLSFAPSPVLSLLCYLCCGPHLTLTASLPTPVPLPLDPTGALHLYGSPPASVLLNLLIPNNCCRSVAPLPFWYPSYLLFCSYCL